MNELRNKLTGLINRKDELTDWLDEVSIEIESVKSEIARQDKVIRPTDFFVTVDPPTGTWVVKQGAGCLVTHKLTGEYDYCGSNQSQYKNKNEAYLKVIKTLRDKGWKDE